MSNKFTKEQEVNYLNSLYDLNNKCIQIVKYDNATYKCFEAFTSQFFAIFKIFVFKILGKFPIIQRITVNKRVNNNKNERLYDTRKLSYPPKNFVTRYGIANLKNQSVFYGTFDFMTAAQEMDLEIGDIITVSQWKNKNNSNLVVCSMFTQKPTNENGSFNPPMLKIYNLLLEKSKDIVHSDFILKLMSFYAHCFAEKIDSINNNAYLFSALLANKILYEYENGSIDAILYPSVKGNLQTNNIAIKPSSFDKNYELYHTSEKRVISIDKTQELRFEILGQSKSIIDNSIIWQDIYLHNFSEYKH